MPERKTVENAARPDRKEKGERLEVAITVQPPEFFQENEGKISQVAVTDNFELVFRSRDNALELVIYNELGKKVEVSKKIPVFGLSGVEIATQLSRDNRDGIVWQGTAAYHDTVEEILRKVHIQADEQAKTMVTSIFSKAFPGKRLVSKESLAVIKKMMIPSQFEFTSDSSKKNFVFKNSNNLDVFHTIADNGEVASPDYWQEYRFDTTKILSADFKKFPFLREFMETQKGRLLPNLDIAVNSENGLLNVIDIKKNVRLYTDAAAGYAVDPNDNKTIYYINPQQRELKWFAADQASPAQTEVESKPLPFSGTVKEFKLDPQGNFFICRVEEGSSNRILILEKDTLEISGEVDGVSGHMDTDNLGNLYFVDKDGKFRFATTNFMTFPKGGLEEARKKKREKLLALKDKLSTLDLTKVGKGGRTKELSADATEDQIVRNLAKQIEDRLGPDIEKAKTVDELDTIGLQIDALKNEPELGEHPDIFTGIEKRIQERISIMKTEQLRAGLDEFQNLLDATSTVAQAVELDNYFNQLANDRRGVIISDPTLRKQIDTRMSALSEIKDKKFTEYEGELLSLIADRFRQIQELIKDAATPEEVNALSSEKAVLDFEKALIQIKDRKLAKEWRDKYKDTLAAHKKGLDDKIESQKDAERTRQAQILEESRETFAEIESAIEEITDAKELAKWAKSNPLITKFDTKLLALPEDLRRSELDNLNNLIKERKKDLEHRQVLNIPKKGGEVNFGKETFPVFEDVNVVWQSKVVPLNEGSDFGNLIFEDNMGRVFRPDFGSVPVTLDDPLTKEAIMLFKSRAEKYFESLQRKVPGYSDKWVLNDFNKDILSNVAKLAKIQVNEGRGILILEGEAGTGKNIMLDMFAHFTNRETFTFSCNFQSEKEDITYAFKFDPIRGTYQVDSRLIEMLQTPGAVIILDEINTLPPGVGKMLNPLLDYRRTLFLPDGREIKAHPSVLIVGAMNPQNYLGVKPLSQEVKSRSRILNIDYPPEKIANTTRVTPYEAEILAKYVEALRGVNQEEFVKMWDYVVNNDTANGGDKFLTDERRDAIKKLQQIVKTANKIREAYKAFRTGKSNDIIEFVFSLRESVDITSELNHTKNVKQAILDVVLPKVSDPAEKTKLETIINNV